MKKLWILLLLCPFLAGCESVSDRLYTETMGLTGIQPVRIYTQSLETGDILSAQGSLPAEALRAAEDLGGRKIFIGHAELLCMDGSFTPETAQELLLSEGLSPACKLLYTDVDGYFQNENGCTADMLRISEKNGRLPRTELATALQEWLGDGEMALLPAEGENGLGMVLLRRDGTAVPLSASAVRGMYWLRQDSGETALTVQTKDGWQELSVLRSAREKEARDGAFCCTISVYASGGTPEVREAAKQQILRDCRTAAEEMTAVHGDVIGAQDLLGGLPGDLRIELAVEIR